MSVNYYNTNDFIEFVAKGNQEEGNDIISRSLDWFKRMNKDYKSLKKKELVTEEKMIELADFWTWFMAEFRDDLVPEILDAWGDNPPVVFEEVTRFLPRYEEIKMEKALSRVAEEELGEVETLFHSIWDKNVRTELSVDYFDWENDDYESTGYTLPRLNRDIFENRIKATCADIIYNRGHLLIKFFSKPGKFEYSGVAVDEDGKWYCLDKKQLQSEYTNEENRAPIGEGPGEKVIKLRDYSPARGKARKIGFIS